VNVGFVLVQGGATLPKTWNFDARSIVVGRRELCQCYPRADAGIHTENPPE